MKSDELRPAGSTLTLVDDAKLYRKISWKLIPFLFIGLVFSFLDRVNIGYAQLQMKTDLGFNDTVYGLGAGLFFATYFIFEVPSNLLLKRVGARLTMARIMILWGLVSSSMLFVKTPTGFYALRLLLGIFEAGFAPGVMVYLTYWYPDWRRARMAAMFLSGSTVAGLIGSPISGLILDGMGGIGGLRGWQWLFLMEGIPAVLLGFLALRILPDGPQKATWLSDRERQHVASDVDATSDRTTHGFAAAAKDPNVYLIAFSWFTIVCGLYAVSFWMPMMLKDVGVKTAAAIGAWSVIPYGCAAISMISVSRHSDARGERRWHAGVCCFLGAAALAALSQAGHSLPFALVALSVATASVFTAMPILFSIPMTYLPRDSAAGGLALINSLGQIAGILGPFLLGWIRTSTGSLNDGLFIMAGLLAVGACIILGLVRTSRQSDGALPVSADVGT